MGLFSSEPKTYVASSVYNLAGDVDLRPNYMSNILIGSRLVDSKKSMGELLFGAHQHGIGMKQRRFFKWAQDNYHAMPEARITNLKTVDGAAVKAGVESILSLSSGQYVRIHSAVIDDADVDYWADDYVHRNHPGLTEDQWSAEYNSASGQIEVQLPTGLESFAAPADYLWGIDRSQARRILFVSYNILTTDSVEKPRGPWVPPPWDPEAVEPPPEYWTVVDPVPNLFLTYRMGSGNVALDALEGASTTLSEFFPVLPLRLGKIPVQDSVSAGDIATIRKGYKKLTGRKLDDLLAIIEDNENVDDIDFAFLVQGVSLNSKESQGKAYLYKFFEELRQQQQATRADFEAYKQGLIGRDQDFYRWNRWELAHERDAVQEYSPVYETPPPNADSISGIPNTNELRIHPPNQQEFDYRVRWAFIEEKIRTGNGSTYDSDPTLGPMRVGEYRFQIGPDYTFEKQVPSNTGGRGEDSLGAYKWVEHGLSTIYLTHQHKPYLYRQLRIVGLEHRNYVYNDTAVTIGAKEALEDTEESGFVVPLHYPTLRELGLYKGTQLATANSYIVFNSYKVVQKKWYQTGFFKILIVIVIAAVSIIFPPAASAAASTGAAIGAGVGLTATLIGAIANGITAMIVSMVATKGATKLFGEEIGAIIGTIVSFVAMQYASSYLQTGTFTVDWSYLMRAENILDLTDAVGSAYEGYLAADTAGAYADLGDLGTDYADQVEQIEQLTKDVLGMTNGSIDPMILTEAEEYFSESSETFLSRTLMTGTDIAELTRAMIENFAEISLELPKAIA